MSNQPEDVGGLGVDRTEFRIATAPIRGVELREVTGTTDSWTIGGYAAVFDQETTLMDGNFSVVKESIAPGAFSRVLGENPLVHLNFGHDMNRVVASTRVGAGQVGGLTLRADDQGLFYLAKVDPADPDAQAMAVKMRNGVVNQASFAFTIGREEQTITDLEDGRTQAAFRILEVKNLYDVCACAQGAYPQTSSMLRSLAQLHRPDSAGVAGRIDPSGGAVEVHAFMAGQELEAARAAARAKARARARAANLTMKENQP